MFYDLHIHSCLSPCADDEMTPANILNMAIIKQLDLIAITDHNTTKQSLAVMAYAVDKDIEIIYGCELQTIEEVHVLGYFKTCEEIIAFQTWIDKKLPIVKNDIKYFGNQYVYNKNQVIASNEENLLLVSLNASLEECIDAIHQYHGKVVIAHVLDRQNSIVTQLGFIPESLSYDGLEIHSIEQKETVLKMHPWISENKTDWFYNSDAHQLIDINEPIYEKTAEQWQRFWGINQ